MPQFEDLYLSNKLLVQIRTLHRCCGCVVSPLLFIFLIYIYIKYMYLLSSSSCLHRSLVKQIVGSELLAIY